METGTVSTEEGKQPVNEATALRDGQPKEQVVQDAAKNKDAKPNPERKRARSLSEDKRFKLFSGTLPDALTATQGRACSKGKQAASRAAACVST